MGGSNNESDWLVNLMYIKTSDNMNSMYFSLTSPYGGLNVENFV